MRLLGLHHTAFILIAVFGLPFGHAVHFRGGPAAVDPDLAEAEALASEAEGLAQDDTADFTSALDVYVDATHSQYAGKVTAADHPQHVHKAAADHSSTHLLHHSQYPVASIDGAALKSAVHSGNAETLTNVVRAATKKLVEPLKQPTPPTHKVAEQRPQSRARMPHRGKVAGAGAPGKHTSVPRTFVNNIGERVMNHGAAHLHGHPVHPYFDRHAPPPAGLRHEVDQNGHMTTAFRHRGYDHEQHTHDLSQVEPGIAYGAGLPHQTAEEKRALEEAERIERREQQRLEAEKAASVPLHTEPSADAKQRQMLHEVEELEEKITEETKSESLAYMLGGLKIDLHQLNERVDMLHKEVEDGVKVDPDIDSKLVYPLSACMRCIFLLSALYFMIYTASVAVKVFVDLFELDPECTAQRALRDACDSVFYAPMLCVLFIGAHMRALQITLGRRGPQQWADVCMHVCAWCCLMQTLMTLAIPFFSNRRQNEKGGYDIMQQAASPSGGVAKSTPRPAEAAGFLSFMKYASLAGMYVGLTLVCAAVMLMDARSLGAEPVQLWDDPRTAATEYAPPVSVAMTCTITLTFFFFVVHLLHSTLWSCKELACDSPVAPDNKARNFVVSWEECLRSCTSAVNLSPMLCILFIAARMRALQMDPKWGRPQPWAELFFYVSSACVIVQTLLIIIAKLLGSDDIVTPRRQNEQRADSASSQIQTTVLAVSYAVVAVTFLAIGVVMYSVFAFKAKNGAQTPPVSPAMWCCMILVVVYLGVYPFVFMAQAALEAARQPSQGGQEQAASMRLDARELALVKCRSAENTVKIAPMMAVLFVGARVRALQLSNQKGSPQCFAQDAMYLATAAVVLQLAVVVLSSLVSSRVEVDKDGTLLTTRVGWLPGRIFLELMKAITFIMLFGGVLTVVASILVIRPESAKCATRGFTGI